MSNTLFSTFPCLHCTTQKLKNMKMTLPHILLPTEPSNDNFFPLTELAGFSLRILVAEKGVTLQDNILKEAPRLRKK